MGFREGIIELKRLSVEQRTLAEAWHWVDVGGIEEVG